jgi:hypothetical protein
MKTDVHQFDLNEKFVFSDSARKTIFTILGIGLLSFVIGLAMLILGGGHDDASHALAFNGGDAVLTSGGESGGGHHAYHWTQRLKVNLWINNIFFLGITIVGVFFVAIQYAAHAGWSVVVKRVPEAFGHFLPYIAVLMLLVFGLSYHEIFHWTDSSLYDQSSPNYDPIIDGKKGFLNLPFYLTRMVIFLGGWMAFFFAIRKQSLAEDLEPNSTKRFWKIKTLATLFIIFFAVSSSVSAWDWVLSIDTHWFSTMFGWYVFASWFVSGLSAITLAVLYLKDAGYLKMVSESHLHDLGKFVFAFSIFWTYIWFSQFLLIYYANVPEEVVYFLDRLESDYYGKFIFINLFLNFFFPFLGLMTRDAKRKAILLKIVCFVVLIGHWFDFYLMITPGTLKENGGFHFLEIGLTMMYLAGFIFVVANALTKAPLIAKNHPMLQESLNHHI